jgi:GT2 family glycosyltransferase
VSVVVPTYRRPDLLERCLTALLAQDLSPCDYEVIVSDDAVADETRRQVEAMATCMSRCGHTLRYIPVTCSRGPAAARNAGWRAARGAIIAFTDDDCIPAPNWLSRGIAAFADGVDGVSGKLVVPVPPVPTDYERNAAQLAHAEFVTANSFYRRSAIAAVGGFDERFLMAWREDSDLHFALLKRGARLVRVPEAAVVHPIRSAGWGVSLRQQRKSYYNALLYKKHPHLYRKFIQAFPPWRYYAIVAALLVAFTGASSGHLIWAWTGGLLWFAFTVRFGLYRLRGTSHAPSHIAEMVVTSALIPPVSIFWRIYGALRWRVWFL